MTHFDAAISQARQGIDLTAEQTSDLIDAMLRGDADDDEVGDLLLALREKGESVDELVGAAQAMRRHMTRIPHEHSLLLDTCGTGGSGSDTFNISTAVAIVVASAGVPVAKHGNRRATSRTGSADVLEQLGVTLESEPDAVAQRLAESGICFCFAPKLHPAMKHVAAVRRRLGVRTLFNLLGPLCNPAGATHHLLGTSDRQSQEKIAAALGRLDTSRAFVVHSGDGQDEVSLCAPTDVFDVEDGEVTGGRWTPADFGLLPAGRASLVAADPAESARIIRQVFQGEPGPRRDTVLAGAAAALLLVGSVSSLKDGVRIAAECIDQGATQKTLEQLCSG